MPSPSNRRLKDLFKLFCLQLDEKDEIVKVERIIELVACAVLRISILSNSSCAATFFNMLRASVDLVWLSLLPNRSYNSCNSVSSMCSFSTSSNSCLPLNIVTGTIVAVSVSGSGSAQLAPDRRHRSCTSRSSSSSRLDSASSSQRASSSLRSAQSP